MICQKNMRIFFWGHLFSFQALSYLL